MFDLYDFNELNSLSRVDIEFMIIAAQTATLKIYEIKAVTNDEDTEIFLANYFDDENRINISQFLKWCESQDEVQKYCEIIKKDVHSNKKIT